MGDTGCSADLPPLFANAFLLWRLADGKIEMWDRGAEEFYGFQVAEALGQNYHDLLQTLFPCSLPEFESVVRLSQYWEGELVHRTKGGREVRVASKIQLMQAGDGVDYLLEIDCEIAESKQVEEKLRMSEQRYQAIFENNIAAFILASSDGTIDAANAEACRIFGMNEEEIVAAGRNGLVDTTDPRLQFAIEERARTGRFKGELNHRRKDGTIFPGEISAVSFTDNNNCQKTVISIQDTIEHEDRINRQNIILEAINRVYEKAIQCKTIEDFGQSCLIIIKAVTGSKFGIIIEIGPDGLPHDIAISDHGWEVRTKDCRIPVNSIIFAFFDRVYQEGKSLLANDLCTFPGNTGGPEGDPCLTALLIVPFIQDGRPVGMIGVANRAGGYHHHDLEILEALTSAIFQALGRMLAEVALRRSEESLHILFQGIPVSTVVFEKRQEDLVIVDHNQNGIVFGDWKKKSYLGKTVSELYAARPDIQERFKLALENKTNLQYETTYQLLATGEIKYLKMTFTYIPPARVLLLTEDITEYKLAEEALQVKQAELTAANEEMLARAREIREQSEATARARDEAEQRAAELDATISSIAAGVIIYDNLGQIIRINDFARNLLCYTNDLYDISYQERLAMLNLRKADGLPYEVEEMPLYRALRGEIIPEEEAMIARAAGKPLWISGTLAPIKNIKGNLIGVILIFTDITVQKRKVEDRLASERELLKVTLNSLGEGVVATDKEERIVFINETAAKITGYSQNEAIGAPVTKILYILDDQTSEPISATTSQKNQGNLILVTRDLREVPINFNCSPIKASDEQILGTVTVFQDISEKQKIELELLKAAKLESLGILAGGVAHDFNNILAGIIANLQLAMIKLKNHQDITKYMDGTIDITRKASELTKQLLTFAKGGDPVKKSATIANLVKNTVQFALSGSKVKAKFHLSDSLWAVDIDEGQITQVINNLTINAEQAMPTGGILEVFGENIVWKTSGQYTPGHYVKLTIKDHGIGIPAEIINKIYDPFFTTKETGNGLGLSTSYSIIKKHNGYLEVESIPGISTSFYILLPASLTELTFQDSQKELAVSGEAKVLLMDDEDTIRNVGGEMLASFGYLVSLAKDGQEAIELYQKAMAIGEPFDVVIMDLTIPGGLGGVETMAILRQIDPEIKAIISSGYASDPVMFEYEKYGFCGVVIKPYKFDELAAVLNKVIDKNQLPLDFIY